MRFGTIRFFTASSIYSPSRIILRNNIVARLHAAAPFLTLDQNPYMVIAGGKLYWIADAYTTTDRYPYSQPQGGINYIRNSVKVVIDAYNGSMKFYVADPTDPIIRTYEKIFPGMFTPFTSHAPGAARPRALSRRTSSTCSPRSSPPTTSPSPTCSTTRATSGRSRPARRSPRRPVRWSPTT